MLPRHAFANVIQSMPENESRLSFNALWQRCRAALIVILSHGKTHGCIIAAVVAVLVLTGGIELLMGRSPLGPDGKFGLWEGNIWSSECSQRLADPYSFSHVGHGILFFGLLWVVARKIVVRYRFFVAVLLEASWELLENSPLIINRYRETTIALGYVGDSVMNSLSDIIMMSLGFLLACHVRPRTSVAVLLAMEIGCAFWIRDNLTLNIIMLLHPIPAIKAWQMATQPSL